MKSERKPPSASNPLIAGLLAAQCIAPVFAEETRTLPAVEVSASPTADSGLVQLDRSTPTTVYRVGGEALRLFDNPGGTNPYTAVAEVPGVKITTADAYGLNNMQGGQKGMRVRGEVSTHGVSGTVEGLSLGGPGPGPGYLFLFDKENLAGLAFSQGAVAPDRGGLFNTYGALDSQLAWPREQARREISLAAGADSFRRVFARLDTGRLESGTALFLSASDTSADKWRGSGQAPAERRNVELALSQKSGAFDLKLIVASNEQAQHSYKALTYAQATDLAQFRNVDYGTNPATADYYDYNRQEFRNQVLLAELEYRFSPQTSVVVKPYYATEEGYYLFAGSSATQVVKWLIDHETYGLTGELRTVLGSTDLKLGYSWTSTEPPGPPTTRKQYTINNGNLVFDRWAMLSKTTERHEFRNLYAVAQNRFGATTVQGGLRYAQETLPAIQAYTTGNGTAGAAWDVSADEAYGRATANATRSVGARRFGYWLPHLAASHELNPATELRASLGRNIGAPSFDAYNQAPAGQYTTSQAYWDQLRPELSTNLDLGARLRFGRAHVDPTLYFSRSTNKGVSVFNPATNTVWSQNVGKTRARGLQLAGGWSRDDSLRLFGNISYSESYFAEDVLTAGGATLPVKGRQLPDVPKQMANLGLAWSVGGYTVAPVLQYVGQRWTTSTSATTFAERMPGYTTADISIGYGGKSNWGGWNATLSIMNLFDRRYIGQISTSEINTTANGAIYYPGAARTAVLKLAFDF